MMYIHDLAFGAELVEFDVQLTKDNVPVIYHDFFVHTDGLDMPVPSLTLQQFRNIGKATDVRKRLASAAAASSAKAGLGRPEMASPRSGMVRRRSEGDLLDELPAEYSRSNNTVAMMLEAELISGPLPTLEEILDGLPPTVGLDVELKYPTLIDMQTKNAQVCD